MRSYICCVISGIALGLAVAITLVFNGISVPRKLQEELTRGIGEILIKFGTPLNEVLGHLKTSWKPDLAYLANS